VPTTEATTPRKRAGRQTEASTGAAPEAVSAPASATPSSGADDREDTATVADGQV
jgi:hypothetical protein